MQVVESIEKLRRILAEKRRDGATVAFVPTMGNLHEGHLALVREAGRRADCVAASVFVNPTQFGPDEDYDAYPRTEVEDRKKLERAGADLLFLPGVDEIYPQGSSTTVEVRGLSDIHCGKTRPGHFKGMTTVVCKLFNMVQPDVAIFGEKDFQQLTVIRAMVRDLNIPVRIEGVATVRESDGLAMSSRNGYLTEEERGTAPLLYRTLRSARDAVLAGRDDFGGIEKEQCAFLSRAGFVTDYFTVCRSGDLQPAAREDTEIVILAAARLGRTRLIDNIRFSRG